MCRSFCQELLIALLGSGKVFLKQSAFGRDEQHVAGQFVVWKLREKLVTVKFCVAVIFHVERCQRGGVLSLRCEFVSRVRLCKACILSDRRASVGCRFVLGINLCEQQVRIRRTVAKLPQTAVQQVECSLRLLFLHVRTSHPLQRLGRFGAVFPDDKFESRTCECVLADQEVTF